MRMVWRRRKEVRTLLDWFMSLFDRGEVIGIKRRPGDARSGLDIAREYVKHKSLD